MNKNKFQIQLTEGSILCCSWGYDQTNIDFYQVVRLVGKTMCEVVKIESIIQSSNEYYDFVMPYPTAKGTKTYKRKIKYWSERPSINISSFEFASLWDGSPKSQTNPLYGR